MVLSNNNSNALILSHYWKRHRSGIAPIDVTRDFLMPKVKNLITIEHPFPNSGYSESIVNWYQSSVLKSTYVYKLPNKGTYLPFVWHYLLTVLILIRFINFKFDLAIAINNLLLLSVLWLKLFRKIDKLVYYTIDYMDTRFESKFINDTYHTLDKLACKISDKTWVVVDRQIEIRRSKGIIKPSTNISVVPMAFDQSKRIQNDLNKVNLHRLVYVGTLLKKQGIQMVIDSIVQLKKIYKDISLHIVGFGEYEETLKSQVKNLKLSKYVKFYGYIGDKDEIDNILSFSAIGIATYVPNSDNFTYFADPSKVKVYLSCGIPVLLTNVPALAATVSKTKSGVVVDYNLNSIVKGISQLIENKENYLKYKKSAIKLGATFNKEIILGKAISEL